MKERPILFSAPMVRALLDGSKTQTRRVVKPQPLPELRNGEVIEGVAHWRKQLGPLMSVESHVRCPYGMSGDRLWGRETWSWLGDHRFEDHRSIMWRATQGDSQPGDGRWRPAIHMPRWASRIGLEVTRVRVERLQDISDADAQAEGVEPYDSVGADQRVPGPGFDGCLLADQPHRLPYADLWGAINGSGSWAKNPWVWVIEFKRVHS